jgi:hypothetical protein
MGLIVVMTLLIGRLAGRRSESGRRSSLATGALLGIVLGVAFYLVDLRDAVAVKQAVEQVVEYVGAQRPQGGGHPPTIWFAGHWGFKYYAERAGMHPVVPASKRTLGDGTLPVPSSFAKGDLLILPDEGIDKQSFYYDAKHTESLAVLQVQDALPLRTLYCYYSGPTAVEHFAGPRRSITILRITQDSVPVSTRLPMSASRGQK